MKFKHEKFGSYSLRIHGKGKPLFALHGFSGSAKTWDKLNIPGYQIFAIDLIGHGESDKPVEINPYELNNILDDLSNIFYHFATDQPYTLLGYSLGGRLALQYASEYTNESLEHLIIESASAGISARISRQLRRASDEGLALKIMENGSEWFANYWGALPIFESQRALSIESQDLIWAERAENHPHALANTLRSTGQGNLLYLGNNLVEIPYPMLYLSGELDTKYQKIAQKIFAPCPNIVTVSISNAGHNVHLERPDEYNKILSDYLA